MGLGQGGVRCDEGVLGVRVAGFETGDETLGEAMVTEPQRRAHHRGRRAEKSPIPRTPGIGLDLDKKLGRGFVLAEPGAGQGSGPKAEDDGLRVLASRERRARASRATPPSRRASPRRARTRVWTARTPWRLEHVPARLEARGDLGSNLEHLVELPDVSKRIKHARREEVDHLGEPSGLREGDPLAQDLQGSRRPLDSSRA